MQIREEKILQQRGNPARAAQTLIFLGILSLYTFQKHMTCVLTRTDSFQPLIKSSMSTRCSKQDLKILFGRIPFESSQ